MSASLIGRLGSKPVLRRCPHHVRYYFNSGANADIPALRIRAISCRGTLNQRCASVSDLELTLSLNDGLFAKEPPAAG
jgi:hypothetical protein